MDSTPFEPRAATPQVLRYLIAVSDQGSFRRAADSLSVAQASLSEAVAIFEQRLACRIFERSRGGTHTTAVGERVVDAARRALEAIESLERLAQSARPPFYGPLRLGIIPTVGPYALPFVHEAITEAFPGLELTVSEMTTDACIASLQANRIDCAMLAILPGMGARFGLASLYEEPFLAALPANHPQAGVPELEEGDLALEELLLLDEGHCLRDQAMAVCSMQGAQGARSGYRATSLETLRQLVAAGHGMTLLPALAATPHPQLALIPLSGQSGRTIGLIWRRSDDRSDGFTELQFAIRGRLPLESVTPS
jgi:LysR family hydrogen peroxide-inducible transcriptional activator